jgi:hypothetical protein
MVHVTVLVSDTKAEQAIEDVLTAVGVGDIITGIKGHGILLIISLPISSGENHWSGYGLIISHVRSAVLAFHTKTNVKSS